MRILMACTEVEAHGGVQRFNRNLLQAWRELGAEVDVVSVNDAPERPPASASRVRIFGAGRNKARWLATLARLLLTRRYHRFVCAHIHLAPAFTLMLSITGAGSAKRTLILHGVEVWDRVAGPKRAAARHFGRVLSVSRYTAQSFLDQLRTFPEDRIALFPNTVSPGLPVNDAPDARPPSKRTRLLAVSRLARTERDKGILDILAAISQLPAGSDVELTIVGDGDDRPYLEARARALRIADRVIFRGSLADQALWEEYASADVFVLPSRKEGFGIVYLEAMWFGLPVIAASEKGALDVVREGENGYLVPFGDVPALAQRLCLLADYPALRTQLGAAGRALVHRGGEFSFDAFRARCRQRFLDENPVNLAS